MNTDEAKEAATALLATVKKVMTYREIEACEWGKSDEAEADVQREIRSLMRDDNLVNDKPTAMRKP